MGNKFRLGRKIGSGSFGEIYLGSSFTQPFVSIQYVFFFDICLNPKHCIAVFIGTHIQTHEEVAIKLVSSLLRCYICFFFSVVSIM